MISIKLMKKKINNFLRSIDTITTKLLTLVLFVIIIPIVVVGNYSTDIINQSNSSNLKEKMALNTRLYEQKTQIEYDKLKLIAQNSIKRIIGANSSKQELLKDIQLNNDLDFCVLFTKNGGIEASSGVLTNKEIRSAFRKIINISFSGEVISSAEKIGNNIYEITIMPVFTGNSSINEVLMIGKSYKKSALFGELKNLTSSSVVLYITHDGKANILGSNTPAFQIGSEIPTGGNFDGLNLLNPAEAGSVIQIKNYFNEIIGNVYLGVSHNSSVEAGDQNIKSIGIIAVISLLVAMFIAAWFARTITSPILGLVEAAESIALGDLEHQVKIKGNDEMAQLASTFNQMSSNLKKQEHLRDNFVATLTHDLKVPMLAENQTITYLLKGAYGEISEEQREVLDLIRSTNNSSLEMIGTLLEVYRYDSGNVRLFESEFDIVDLLKDSINQIKSLADDKKIQINVSTTKEQIFVKADKREIKRVMHNLISNAINNGINRGFINCNIDLIEDKISYKPQNSVDCYTTLTRTLNLTNCLVFSVEDNGIGLAREDMPLLFQRFSLSKGRKPAGAGLGLYYSYQVIIQHNGNIWAESCEKGGSTFKLTLPV